MAPDESVNPSYPEMSYPSMRDRPFYTGSVWLEGKALDDGAEGLWRIHDKLYDFTSFVNLHPGGSGWLSMTKGTDITEAFESHHVKSATPERLLSKYYVREATKPRHSPFTFREDGFYRTLKARIRDELKKVPEGVEARSKRTIEALTLALFVACYAACRTQSAVFALLAGLFMAWTIVAAHNFLHQSNNWRMYLFNFSFISTREMRISHALSHHLFPNTLLDFEITSYRPFFHWLPKRDKTLFQRYASWIYGPLVYMSNGDVNILRMFLDSYRARSLKTFHLEDAVPLTIPLFLYLTLPDATFGDILTTWFYVWHAGSLIFIMIGINAAHHHPDIFHDGDAPKVDRDWGLHQLNAVMDRVDVNKSHFAVLTHFGEHGLHHLFPTLDHATLPYLHRVFAETCDEFKTELRLTTQLQLVIGQFEQLARVDAKK